MAWNDTWIPLAEVAWSNQEFKQWSIDTRDFHVSASDELQPFSEEYAHKHTERYVYSQEELIAILNDIHERSGGKGKWRYLCFTGAGAELSKNWRMKYLRVRRYIFGFVILNYEGKILTKDILQSPIKMEYLHHH